MEISAEWEAVGHYRCVCDNVLYKSTFTLLSNFVDGRFSTHQHVHMYIHACKLSD